MISFALPHTIDRQYSFHLICHGYKFLLFSTENHTIYFPKLFSHYHNRIFNSYHVDLPHPYLKKISPVPTDLKINNRPQLYI